MSGQGRFGEALRGPASETLLSKSGFVQILYRLSVVEVPWAWVLGGSALQSAVWIREWWHPNIQNLAVSGYGG